MYRCYWFFFLVSWNYFANNYSHEWTGLWILERACPLNRCRDVVRRPASVVSFAMFPSFARAFNEFERNTLGNRYFLLGETRRRNELLERRVCFERGKKRKRGRERNVVNRERENFFSSNGKNTRSITNLRVSFFILSDIRCYTNGEPAICQALTTGVESGTFGGGGLGSPSTGVNLVQI